jgi:CheY-like chemotaxis protein
MRLLLVDDDAALRELLRATFESFDIEVLEAASGEEAEATVRLELPDVIVLDVLMPGIDGLVFCHRGSGNPRHRCRVAHFTTSARSGSRTDPA